MRENPNAIPNFKVVSCFSPIGGCTPVYADKINPYVQKDLKILDDYVLYEPDGPLFEVGSLNASEC